MPSSIAVIASFTRRLIVLLVAISILATADAAESVKRKQNHLRRRTDAANTTTAEQSSSLLCLILKVHVQTSTGEEEHLECDLISEDDGAMSHGLQIKLPNAVVDDNDKALHRGEWYVRIVGAKIEETIIEGLGSLQTSVFVPNGAKIITLSPEEGDLYVDAVQGTRSSRYLVEDRSLAAKSVRKVMVCRVSFQDRAPTYTAAQLQQYYFSLNSYSMTRQFALCSSSWMWFKGYKSQQAGTPAPSSVVEVYLPVAAASMSRETAWAAALTQLQNKFGVSNINTLTNHVAFVLPEGMQGGKFYAVGTVGSFRTVFSDTYGGIPNTVMHELGHNLGLNHAGLGADEYGDETDIMGYGAFQQFGPSKCFNGAHLWDLGWFSDKTATVNPFTHRIVQLASFADYPKLVPGHYVDLNVGPYYLVFNRAAGVNAGTGDVANTVTITTKGTYTQRVGAISNTTGPFQVGNYQGSSGTLIIKVCRFIMWNNIQIALVSIGVNNGNCS